MADTFPTRRPLELHIESELVRRDERARPRKRLKPLRHRKAGVACEIHRQTVRDAGLPQERHERVPQNVW